jgi:hypothetical protein
MCLVMGRTAAHYLVSLTVLVFRIRLVFWALICVLLLFGLVIIRVFLFKLVFSESVVVVWLLLLANSVHVDVYCVNCLRGASWLVLNLWKLSVEFQKLLLTDQSTVRSLNFRILVSLQLLNQFFLLPAFRLKYFVLLLKSLERSYLVSN